MGRTAGRANENRGLFYLSPAFILFCCPALHRRHLPPAFQREVISMNRTYHRGDMYYADLGRGIGSEQEGYRPVLIIQNDTGNKHSPTVIVAAISSKVDAKAKLPSPAFYYPPQKDGYRAPHTHIRTGPAWEPPSVSCSFLPFSPPSFLCPVRQSVPLGRPPSGIHPGN